MYELIIVGGGPAGLTAGIYAARKQLKTLLLSKDFVGQVGESSVIENWPGEKNIQGSELIEKFQEHLKDYKIDIKEQKVLSLGKQDNFLLKTNQGEFKAKAVIIATGRKPKSLGIPGEQEFLNKGVSYCVTCDGVFFKNKPVVVVGGGNAGFEGAIELANYAKEVFLLENLSQFQADEVLQKKAKEKGIKLLNQANITEIRGDNFVQEIVYNNQILKTAGVFIEIGADPVTNFLPENLVEFNKFKEVKIDSQNQTKTSGLFAAGDVTTIRDKQIVIATGEGAKAVFSAYEFLK